MANSGFRLFGLLAGKPGLKYTGGSPPGSPPKSPPMFLTGTNNARRYPFGKPKRCDICLEDISYRVDEVGEQPHMVICGHIFGHECILNWIQDLQTQGQQPTCPACRRKLVWDSNHLSDCQHTIWPQPLDTASIPITDPARMPRECLECARHNLAAARQNLANLRTEQQRAASARQESIARLLEQGSQPMRAQREEQNNAQLPVPGPDQLMYHQQYNIHQRGYDISNFSQGVRMKELEVEVAEEEIHDWQREVARLETVWRERGRI